MSKIGKTPIKIPEGVDIKSEKGTVFIKGPKGEASVALLEGVDVNVAEGEVKFSINKKDSKQVKSNWGTARSLVYNAVLGVTEGFQKILIIEGVGYKARKEGGGLVLNLGYSHPLEYKIPEGIDYEVEGKNNVIKIEGIDKFLVGQVAAEIKSLRPVEPYKGKGIRYSDEIVRRKAGKKVTTTTGE